VGIPSSSARSLGLVSLTAVLLVTHRLPILLTL
jgi:hypothetical protein